MPAVLAHQEIRLEVQDASIAALDSWEFAHFLYLFRAAYSRALELDLPEPERVADEDFYFARRFAEPFYSESAAPAQVATLFMSDWGDDELRFQRVSRSSPLEITCICLASALTLAVIVSGGKASFAGFHFTLPPLGRGIKNLRDAFRLQEPTRRRRLR
jgi:hypothetical protein